MLLRTLVIAIFSLRAFGSVYADDSTQKPTTTHKECKKHKKKGKKAGHKKDADQKTTNQ
jgi:polyferredoxin